MDAHAAVRGLDGIMGERRAQQGSPARSPANRRAQARECEFQQLTGHPHWRRPFPICFRQRSDTGSCGLEMGCRTGYVAQVFLALFALLTSAIEPSAASCPADKSGVERALRLQVEADSELAAGRHAPAAARLGEVAGAYPECTAYHKRRMNAVLRAVEAWRVAFEASGDRSHIDTALAFAGVYLESLTAVYGAEAVAWDGYLRLQQSRTELQALLPVVEAEPPARAPTNPLDRAPTRRAQVELEGPRSADAPTGTHEAHIDPRRKKLLVAGGVALGAGAGSLIMLITGALRASTIERDIEDPVRGCTEPVQAVCADVNDRGERANRVFAAGLVMTPVFVGVGVALVAVAHRRRSDRSISLVPTIDRRYLGLGLEARF